MVQVQRIDSLELPELQPYRTMRRQKEHEEEGIFVAEGEKVVRRLLESNFTVISLLLPEKWLRDLEALLQARPEVIKVFVAAKEELEGLTGFSMYQGLLAVGRIPERISLEQLLARSAQPWLLAAADNLSSAENLGALVRNCAAFNVQGLFIGETASRPFLRRAVRSFIGNDFQLTIVEMDNLATTLRELQGRHVLCLAAHPHASGRTLSQANFQANCCIVFGSEGYGITPTVLDLCDEAIAIPMPASVDSLNVGSAAAAFLYEANRQRGKM